MSDEILTGAQAALKWSQRTPEATAVVYGRTSYSYSTLATQIAQFVTALEREGIGHGDLVGVCCRNHYLPLVLCWSLEAIGAITTYLSSDDLGGSEMLDHCDAALAENPLSQASAPRRHVHLSGDWIRAATETPVTAADIRRLDHPTSDDTAVFIDGSSGTTGRKKYCIDTRRMIVERNRLRQKLHFPGDRRRDYINLYGTQLNAATIPGVLALNKGSRIVLSSMASFFSDIEKYPASKSTLLLRDAEYFYNNFHDVELAQRLDSLRVIGALLPQHIRRWLEGRIAGRVVNTYSSNETGLVSAVDEDGEGLVLPGVEVRIVDASRQERALGESGYIAVRSSQVAAGYLWDEEMTARHFDGGWFITSDHGYLKEGNRLVVLGRADEMLNLGGVKIAPGPLEDALRRIDGVVECVLLGDPIHSRTDTVVVCVETNARADSETINAAVSRLLAGQFPRVTIAHFERFPRTATGKVQRSTLRKLLVADTSPGEA